VGRPFVAVRLDSAELGFEPLDLTLEACDLAFEFRNSSR
jgi:hypothetical protein